MAAFWLLKNELRTNGWGQAGGDRLAHLTRRDAHSDDAGPDLRGEVLNLLGIWRSASFADVNQQTGFDEPGKGAPHGDETTCFASHA
jgi:hypothetical protein